LQFKCDKVNFEDLYSTKEVLFEKIDMLTSPFTLPMIPTELVSEKDIYNLGYLLIQPIIFITNTAISTGTQPLEYGFEVLNETYDQKIKLNYHTSYGEVIKIDVFNREITSILNGVETSLINYISDDTNLENFFFDLGVNHIKFNNYNVEEVLIAYTEYSNLWIEVV
jgi:phage-related protein